MYPFESSVFMALVIIEINHLIIVRYDMFFIYYSHYFCLYLDIFINITKNLSGIKILKVYLYP